MTKPERTKVLKAIKLLMGDDCQLHEAVDLLGSMVGLKTAVSMIGKTKRVSVHQVAPRANQTFRWRRPK